MKGKQHKEGHKKDDAHQGQQNVAADEQSVHYLQEKDDSDELISIFKFFLISFYFTSWPLGVSRGLWQRRFQTKNENAWMRNKAVTCCLTCINNVTMLYSNNTLMWETINMYLHIRSSRVVSCEALKMMYRKVSSKLLIFPERTQVINMKA